MLLIQLTLHGTCLLAQETVQFFDRTKRKREHKVIVLTQSVDESRLRLYLTFRRVAVGVDVVDQCSPVAAEHASTFS